MNRDRNTQQEGDLRPPAPTLPERVILFGGAVSGLLILIALAVVCYAVFWRYLAGQPVNWADELTGYLVVGMFDAGLGAALLSGNHIGIDLITGLTQGRVARVLRLWSAVSVLIVAGIVCWSAWHSIIFAYGFGLYSNGYLDVPIWLVQAPLVPGAVLLALAAGVIVWRGRKSGK